MRSQDDGHDDMMDSLDDGVTGVCVSEPSESHMLEHDQPRAIMDHQMKDAQRRHRQDHRFYVHSPIINNEQKDNFSRFLSLRHAAQKLMKRDR